MNWEVGHSFPFMQERDIHIWYLDSCAIDGNFLKKAYSLLSTEENETLDKIISSSRRNEFILGRGSLRMLLLKYLNLDRKDLGEFVYNIYGKPHLNFHSNINFNLTHSNGKILLAFSSFPVGIDLQYCLTKIDFLSMAKRFFSQIEYDAILSSSHKKMIEQFYRYWVCKESFAKGLGLSLAWALKNLIFSFDEDNIYFKVLPYLGDREESISLSEINSWKVSFLSVLNEYFSAISYPGQKANFYLFNLTNDL